MHNGSRGGYIMVELIVAVGVLMVSMGAIFLLTARSIALNRSVSQEYVGTALASEGIELVRRLVEANFKNGREFNSGITPGNCGSEMDYDDTGLTQIASCPGGERKLKFDAQSGYYSYDRGEDTVFTRVITVEYENEPNPPRAPWLMKISSRVAWPGRGAEERSVDLQDIFYRGLRTP